MEIIAQAARDCAQAPWGQSTAIVQSAANVLGLSVQRTQTLVSQVGRELGLSKGRKRRSDAGQSAISAADLQLISGAMTHSRRADKSMLSCKDAIDMLFDAGELPVRLSASRVNYLLHERGMHPKQLAVPAPFVRMRTEHINALWEIDASVCVLYKTPKGELALLQENGVHYKNKLHNYTRVMNDLLVRYVATEHASGAIAVRFYLGGETTENALDFLMWAMTQRHDAQGQPMPLHGVPFMLYTDQGSAFKSGPFVNFCRAMDIRLEHHVPGNSRATGQVENAQNLVELGLESRLRFLAPESITMERLNALGELWMHSYNGTRRHGRHGMTRYEAWSTIAAEHLRIAPAMAVMRMLPASKAETRRVSGDMRVSFVPIKGQGSHEYDVRYVPGLSPGDTVYVTVNPMDMPNVRVGVTDRDTGEIVWHQVQPVQKGWMGYDAEAPVAGKEFKAQPTTPAQKRSQAIAAQAFATAEGPATPDQVQAAQRSKATPYAGQFDPLADLKAAKTPTYLLRKGTAHTAVTAASVEELRVSVAEACKRIRLVQGEAYDPATYAWLTERYGSAGVPVEAVEAINTAYRQGRIAAPVGLRVVGGGA